jgi:hypothetical protein
MVSVFSPVSEMTAAEYRRVTAKHALKGFNDSLQSELLRYGYDAQQTGEPRDPQAPHDLWESVPGDFGAHGRFDDIAKA